jgi:hypothetical protein
MMVALMLLGTLMEFSSQLLAQDQEHDHGWQKIVFHVTSVRSEDATDWCQTGECSATRFTIEGYSDVKQDGHLTEYVLKCVEVTVIDPSPHKTFVCAHLHANNDYDALLVRESISFYPFGKPMPAGSLDQALSLYSIASEKEMAKPKKEISKPKQ